jgi:hypothetical protein
MDTRIAKFMPQSVNRLSDGHFRSSPCIDRLRHSVGVQIQVAHPLLPAGFRTNGVNERRNVHDARERKKVAAVRRSDPCRLIFAPTRAANSRLLNRDRTSAAYVSYRTEAENRAH